VLTQLPGWGQPEIKTQLAYVSDIHDQMDIFLLSDQDQEPELFIYSHSDDIYPTWSSDGKSLAYLRADADPQAYWIEPQTDLYLVQNLVQSNLTANLDLFIRELVWSPNGFYISFAGSEKDPPPLEEASVDIYIAKTNSRQVTRIVDAGGVGCHSLSWAPDNLELVSACRGNIVTGLLIEERSGSNAWFTDIIPAEEVAWLPSGEKIMVYTTFGRLVSISAEYMRQREEQNDKEWTDWGERLQLFGYQEKAVEVMKWYPGDDNLFMIQSDDLIQVVDLNRGEVISILGQFRGPAGEHGEFPPYSDLTGQISWGPEGEQIAFAFFDGNDAEIGIVNIRTKEFFKITDNLVEDLMPAWRPESR
jgi:WD40 repeat protein